MFRNQAGWRAAPAADATTSQLPSVESGNQPSSVERASPDLAPTVSTSRSGRPMTPYGPRGRGERGCSDRSWRSSADGAASAVQHHGVLAAGPQLTFDFLLGACIHVRYTLAGQVFVLV